MEDGLGTDLSFWPAFADFMLAVILILLLVIGMFFVRSLEDLENVESCQKVLKESMRRDRLLREVAGTADGVEAVAVEQDSHNPYLLYVRFMDYLLFRDDDANLNESGRRLLSRVGNQIRRQIDSIVEIQIRGHADPRRSRRFASNLHLASERANTVFTFLKDQVGINPERHTMSTSSYGEFYPVGRKPGEPWTPQLTAEKNHSPDLRQANRRIELLLFYGGAMRGCSVPTGEQR
jgi:flagellar motor protein MotB